MLDEIRRIVLDSEITKEDDAKWPPRNRDGKQELEIRIGKYHISFEVSRGLLDAFFVPHTNLLLDGQDWVSQRRAKERRPGRPARVLLPRQRSQGVGFFINIPAFQGEYASSTSSNPHRPC